jgi:hypothetical protein
MKGTQVELYPTISNSQAIHLNCTLAFVSTDNIWMGGDSHLNPKGSSFTLLKLYILLCSEMRNFLANKKQFLSGLKTVFLLVLCRAWSQRRELNPRNFLQSPTPSLHIHVVKRNFSPQNEHAFAFSNTSPFFVFFLFSLSYDTHQVSPLYVCIYVYNLGSVLLCTTNDND